LEKKGEPFQFIYNRKSQKSWKEYEIFQINNKLLSKNVHNILFQEIDNEELEISEKKTIIGCKKIDEYPQEGFFFIKLIVFFRINYTVIIIKKINDKTDMF
jgi:hypothetical protein